MNMNIDMNEQKATELLPIVIEGHTFKADAEGLWSLNEIHQTLGLPESKRPHKWNNGTRAALDQARNLGLAHGGANPGTWATEAGTIAYAMWVSTDFYLMVLQAFVTMRNDSILSDRMSALALAESEKLLSANMPKANALMLKAKSHGISWSDACRAAQVARPLLAKQYLVAKGRFQRVLDQDTGVYSIKPIPNGFTKGFFKRQTGVFGNADGWKVTEVGLNWLTERAQEINEAVRVHQAAGKKSKKNPLTAEQKALQKFARQGRAEAHRQGREYQ